MSTKNQKIRLGLLSGLLTATALVGVAGGASSEPLAATDTAAGSIEQAALESTWLDAYFSDALGSSTPIGTKAAGRWIEYNLSNYCVTLHDGDSVPFQTCQTSSGKAGHGTPTGSFTVKRKAAGPICMHPPGDEQVCGIHYATFFTNKGAAFHEAYWMGGRVNQRISHGCVNMRKGDAKVVFDFATVGMPVKVHW